MQELFFHDNSQTLGSVERNGLSFENNSLLQSRELIDRFFIIPGAIGDQEPKLLTKIVWRLII